MPFDGRDYGTQGLITPYPHHPGTPVLASVLADGLRGAYAFCRQNARVIGHQTYAHHQRNSRAYSGGLGHGVLASTWVDVAEFVTWIPEFATHLEAEVHFRIKPQAITTTHARIVTTDGTNTDTGNADSEVFETSESLYWRDQGGVPRGGYFGPEHTQNRTLRPWVAMTNVKPSLNGDITIRVQAYATADAGAQFLVPTFITCWWTAIG